MTSEFHNIGILGGTFDPPHLAHLAMAAASVTGYGLDRVLLIPAGKPPHKNRPDISEPEHRLAMTKLLCEEKPYLEADDIELVRSGKSYTIDTVLALRADMPGVNFRLIIGEDMAAEFHTWKQAEKLIQIAPPLVAARPGVNFLFDAAEQGDMPACMLQQLLAARMNIPLLDISSSAIRKAISIGKDVSHLLTSRVMEYVRAHGLYRVTD